MAKGDIWDSEALSVVFKVRHLNPSLEGTCDKVESVVCLKALALILT